MKCTPVTNDEIKEMEAKTKTSLFVDMVDHLEPGDGGVVVQLDENTTAQTFRTIITRYYRRNNDNRTFMMRQTIKGLLVYRVK